MIRIKAHQNNQDKEYDGFPKFIGDEDYYLTLNGGWKHF